MVKNDNGQKSGYFMYLKMTSKIIKNHQKSSKMVKNGGRGDVSFVKRVKMVKNGQKWVKILSKTLPYFQKSSKIAKIVKMKKTVKKWHFLENPPKNQNM